VAEYPPDRLLAELARARDEGVHFREAWSPAVEAAIARVPHREDRSDWRCVLQGTEQAWLAAYYGRPGPGEHFSRDLVA
jgi:hypothetical protein